MFGYQFLALVADLYTPGLALACFALLLRPLRVRDWRGFRIRTASLAAGAFVAWGLMLLDDSLAIWPMAGLDYSTHIAVALVLALFLSVYEMKWRWPALLSVAAYALLMLVLHYHSLADMVTSAAVVAVFYLRADLLIRRFARSA